jgi:hypothetical protein
VSRPNADLREEICGLVKLGGAPREAAAAKGVDGETFATWLTQGRMGGKGRGPEIAFVRAIEQAEAEAELLMIGRVQRAASDGVWQAAAWLAERRFPSRWTRKSVQEDLFKNTPRTLRGTEDPFAELDNVASIDSAKRKGARGTGETSDVEKLLNGEEGS